MQAQQVILLNKEQIKTTLTNLFKILNYKSHKEIFSGKPKFSKEYMERYNLMHITKFAQNYTVYECTLADDHQDLKLFGIHYMYYIVIESDHFDKLHIQTCSWFYHLFESKLVKPQIDPLDSAQKEISENTPPDKSTGVWLRQPKIPTQVFICPAYVITDQMRLHVPTNIMPCPYTFVSLSVFYPIIGSKNNIFGLAFDYQLIRHNSQIDEVQNKLKLTYPIIYDSDPMVKMFNGNVDDLMVCKRIILDVIPSTEYYIRQIKEGHDS
jgi:hypothetical protein